MPTVCAIVFYELCSVYVYVDFVVLTVASNAVMVGEVIFHLFAVHT